MVVPDCSRELQAPYWGGPEFLPDSGAHYTPLLEYCLPSGRRALAAARTEFGRGWAVLTGVQAEIRGCQFPLEVSRFGADDFAYGMQVSAELTRAEPERCELFQLLSAALQI